VKFNIPKNWIMKKAKLEAGCSVEAGAGPMLSLTREQWVAEVRRLLVEKYALKWPEKEIADYAESIACQSYDDPDWRETPDAAIYEEFQAGM
jgi:hypothetical protein